jgi:tubulin polyglutamylase complex subunit 2
MNSSEEALSSPRAASKLRLQSSQPLPVHIQQRMTFDKVSLGIISYLETLDECHEIQFQCVKEASNYDITLWEKKNAPLKLPNDLKKFYSTVFNGFTLQWNIEEGNSSVMTVGEMRINALEEIKIQLYDVFFVQSYLPPDIVAPSMSNCTLYSLDTNCSSGTVVLLYRYRHPASASSDAVVLTDSSPSSSLNSPEIWLLTATCQLIYICSSFTQYFRLMVSHLGIYQWQLAFSDDGFSEVTEQFMHLFCKERLVIDKHYRLHT